MQLRMNHLARFSEAQYVVPEPESDGYLTRLAEICRKESVDVVLPQTTREVECLARTKHRRRLLDDTGAHVAAGDGFAVRRANSKLEVMEVFQRAGLPVVDFTEAVSSTGLIAAVRQFVDHDGYACAIKPVRSNGSRGVAIVRKMAMTMHNFSDRKPGIPIIPLLELQSMAAMSPSMPPYIVMDYVPGKEYTVDCFRAPSFFECLPRYRRVVRSGITMHAVIEWQERIAEVSAAAAEHLGLFGAFGFQFILDTRDGEPKIIECNPRVQGTSIASYYAGLNLPWLAVKLALGMTIQRPTIEKRHRIEFEREWTGRAFVDGEDVT